VAGVALESGALLDLLHHRGSIFRGRSNDCDVEVLLRRVFLQLRNGTHVEILPMLSDLRFVAVVDGRDVEPALREAAVARECRADLAGADDADGPLFSETEYLTQLRGQLRNGVAEPAFAEGSEK